MSKELFNILGTKWSFRKVIIVQELGGLKKMGVRFLSLYLLNELGSVQRT